MNTSMNLSLFTEEIILKLQKRMGEAYHVSSTKVKKNNGVELTGVIIKEKDSNLSPTIYMNDFIGFYQEGMALNQIADRICEVFRSNDIGNQVDMSEFINYETAKRKIAFKLIDFEKNRELLTDVPYKIFMNLAMVFYYVVTESPFFGSASVLIRNSHIRAWKITTEYLYQNAMISTPLLLPAKLMNIEEMVDKLAGEVDGREKSPAQEELSVRPGQIPMYVLTNKKNVHGAACLFYPGLLPKLAEKLKSNLTILPSSVHEVILLTDRDRTPKEELYQMVCEINRTQVDEMEVLSDAVYFYDKVRDHLSRIC